MSSRYHNTVVMCVRACVCIYIIYMHIIKFNYITKGLAAQFKFDSRRRISAARTLPQHRGHRAIVLAVGELSGCVGVHTIFALCSERSLSNGTGGRRIIIIPSSLYALTAILYVWATVAQHPDFHRPFEIYIITIAIGRRVTRNLSFVSRRTFRDIQSYI